MMQVTLLASVGMQVPESPHDTSKPCAPEQGLQQGSAHTRYAVGYAFVV